MLDKKEFKGKKKKTEIKRTLHNSGVYKSK